MRDDSHFWDPPASSAEIHAGDGLFVRQIPVDRQMLVSGTGVLGQTALPLVEWSDPAPDGAYALVLRRDRIIEVNGPARDDGWDEAAEQAQNDVTDAYAVTEIKGPGALPLLQCGGFVDPAAPSRSVSRLLFGLPTLLYRSGDNETYRLHVPRTYQAALRKILVSHLTR